MIKVYRQKPASKKGGNRGAVDAERLKHIAAVNVFTLSEAVEISAAQAGDIFVTPAVYIFGEIIDYAAFRLDSNGDFSHVEIIDTRAIDPTTERLVSKVAPNTDYIAVARRVTRSLDGFLNLHRVSRREILRQIIVCHRRNRLAYIKERMKAVVQEGLS